jgi:TolA-binding protein
MRGVIAVAWCCFVLVSGVRADTVTLNSGEVLEGQIVSETDDVVEMEVAMYHGTIMTTERIPKADIKSIVRESLADKKAKAAYSALSKYTLNNDQELSSDEYAAGIAAFRAFLSKYPNSSYTGEVEHLIATWSAEAGNVASGKVKFAGQWMSPEQKTARAEEARERAEIESARVTLPSLKAQLADLRTQRAALTANVAVVQSKLAAAQARLASIPEAASSGTTAVGADRPGLAGQLTQRIKVPNQTEAETAAPQSPERTQAQNDIATYQQQINQAQTKVAELDTKIQELQTQIPKLEATVKLAAPENPSEVPGTTVKTNATPAGKRKPAAPAPPPPPAPWYKRAWDWVSSFWH